MLWCSPSLVLYTALWTWPNFRSQYIVAALVRTSTCNATQYATHKSTNWLFHWTTANESMCVYIIVVYRYYVHVDSLYDRVDSPCCAERQNYSYSKLSIPICIAGKASRCSIQSQRTVAKRIEMHWTRYILEHSKWRCRLSCVRFFVI